MTCLSVLVGAFVLVSSVVAAQSVNWTADLSQLNFGGTVIGVQAVELNGRPGSEFLVKVLPPNTLPFMPIDTWTIVVSTAQGLCIAGRVTLPHGNLVVTQYPVDTNGDGHGEYLVFDQRAQTLSNHDFDLSACA